MILINNFFSISILFFLILLIIFFLSVIKVVFEYTNSIKSC